MAFRTPSSLAAIACAALFGGAALPAMAQSNLLPRETAHAFAHREQPAQAPYSDAVAFRLRVPHGFKVNVFASGLRNVRMLEVAPDGTVSATRREQADVLALRDTDGDGHAESVTTFISGLPGVHGIARWPDGLLLANSTTIWRLPMAGGTPMPLIEAQPDGGQHPNRMVRVGPDGALYVSGPAVAHAAGARSVPTIDAAADTSRVLRSNRAAARLVACTCCADGVTGRDCR